MSLTERTTIDLLEVLRDGTVQVREAREVLQDGEVIATRYHRFVIGAADEAADVDAKLSRMPPEAAAVVRAARTPERVARARARGEVDDLTGPPRPGPSTAR